MISLDDMQAFCAVIKYKNFTKASKALHISKPALSRQVARLEHHLDTRLLQRTTRIVTPTVAGLHYYEEACEILLKVERSTKNVKSLTKEVSGVIKIGAPTSINHLYIAPTIPALLRRYPNLDIQMINGNHLMNFLGERFDIVIYCGNLPDMNFHYKKLGEWTRICCASSTYLKEHGEPATPENLKDHVCLDHIDNATNTWKFTGPTGIKDIHIKSQFKSNSSMELRNVALQHAGIVYLPSFIISKELQEKALVPILTRHQNPVLGIYALYPSKQFLSKSSEILLEHLASLF